MTKVEELREQVSDVMEDRNWEYEQPLLDSLIAAAREEGTEQERERIRKAADHYEAEDECPAAQLVDGNYVGASYEMYVVSPSDLALAPKEESK